MVAPSARLTNLLGACSLAMTDDMIAAISETSELVAGALAALATLLSYPALSLDALRKTLRLTPSGAGRLVDRLAEAGLVERRSVQEDQRFIAIHLTARGVKVAKRILESRKAVVSSPLAALSAAEQRTLEQLLEKLLKALTPDRERCDHMCRLCEISACPQDICPVEVAARVAEQSAD